MIVLCNDTDTDRMTVIHRKRGKKRHGVGVRREDNRKTDIREKHSSRKITKQRIEEENIYERNTF